MPQLATPPLTTLSEEEELFRDTVRDFAARAVKPRVAAMARAAAIEPAVVTQCFETGLMGIETPDDHGGAGGTLPMTVLAVEGLSAVDASVAILVDVQHTVGTDLLLEWASNDAERGCKGFSVGKKEDKLGIRASSTCELVLGGCEVSAANVVGEVGKGYKVAIETLNAGRIGIGAQMIGVARGALQAALKYVKERHQFGHPIAEFQAVQFQLAQAATELEAARLMVYNAARLEDAGEPYTMQAAMAKLFAAQVAERVTSLGVELFGGYGYTKEYPVEKFYRDAKIGTIEEGTSNMQLNTIAKQLLK